MEKRSGSVKDPSHLSCTAVVAGPPRGHRKAGIFRGGKGRSAAGPSSSIQTRAVNSSDYCRRPARRRLDRLLPLRSSHRLRARHHKRRIRQHSCRHRARHRVGRIRPPSFHRRTRQHSCRRQRRRRSSSRSTLLTSAHRRDPLRQPSSRAARSQARTMHGGRSSRTRCRRCAIR